MPSNNNRKSGSNKTSNSFGSSNTNWAMLSFVSLAIILFVAYYFAYKSNRESFKNNNSNSTSPPNLNVSSGEKVVALFYADWCPHCVDFKPHYKKAMSELNGKKNKGKTLRFVMVDCDKYSSLSKKHGVSGFPTVKILNSDGSSDEYKGERSYDGLTSYFS
jgi:thiol-disulfide isomerase/thioredoxin